jgi:hypothetical protein
MIRKEELTGF